MRIGTGGPLYAFVAWPSLTGAWAQSNGHHHLRADHYQNWQRPDVAATQGGKWFAWLRQHERWIEIPDNLIVRQINPSPENAHLCWAFERVLCFLPPHTGG